MLSVSLALCTSPVGKSKAETPDFSPCLDYLKNKASTAYTARVWRMMTE